jgi:hypothetical protein
MSDHPVQLEKVECGKEEEIEEPHEVADGEGTKYPK